MQIREQHLIFKPNLDLNKLLNYTQTDDIRGKESKESIYKLSFEIDGHYISTSMASVSSISYPPFSPPLYVQVNNYSKRQQFQRVMLPLSVWLQSSACHPLMNGSRGLLLGLGTSSLILASCKPTELLYLALYLTVNRGLLKIHHLIKSIRALLISAVLSNI